jgi:hypothetical protein
MGGMKNLVIGAVLALVGLAAALTLPAAEPPAINPFERPPAEKADDPSSEDSKDDVSVPGCVELSNGILLPGLISLTRDMRLKIYDEKLERQREIPLRAVKKIACKVKKEWMEREWRFKETTSNEKIYTGRSYPVREYLHTITLADNRKITGPLSAIVYLRPPREDTSQSRDKEPKVEQFVLHKRDKGKVGQELKSLVYVKQIRLGPDAFEEARKKQNKRA